MTVEELMMPRVMAIGTKEGETNYPSSPFKSGEILVESNKTHTYPIYTKQCDVLQKDGEDYLDIYIRLSKSKMFLPKGEIEQYPHLFRPLQWWEFRELEDMPEYVKMNDEIDDEDYHSIYMVTKWFPSDIDLCNVDAEYFDTIEKSYITLPASKQDYDNYIKSQND